MKKFYKMLFFNIMTISTLIAISSISWLTTWIGLEMNLLSLMPLMKEFKDKYSSEATIKYFIIQAMSSALLLFSIVIFMNMKNFSMELTLNLSLMVSFSLLLKMGAAPFHFWFPEILAGLKWEMIFILMTWQKIAPMVLLTYTIYNPMFLSIIIILSAMIGGLQGINQVCLRKILAYSSINHVSWMISAILNSSKIWLYYFIIYCIINLNILIILNMNNIFFTNQLSKLFCFNKKMKFFFMLNFLSLGGLPPFLGFLPKWLTVNHMILNNYYFLTTLLIIFTLISLYFYMRITFNSFTLNSDESLMKIFNKTSYLQFSTNLFSIAGLITCSIITNLF